MRPIKLLQKRTNVTCPLQKTTLHKGYVIKPSVLCLIFYCVLRINYKYGYTHNSIPRPGETAVIFDTSAPRG